MRAGLVTAAESYAWSTAAAHCREDEMDGNLDLEEWRRHYGGARWREVLRVGLEEEACAERLWEATRRGNPLGNDAFVERLGEALGRNLRPRPPGRPKKDPEPWLAGMG